MAKAKVIGTYKDLHRRPEADGAAFAAAAPSRSQSAPWHGEERPLTHPATRRSGWDAAGQLTSGILKKVSDNSVLANNQYIYDKAGNRISSSTNGVYYAATANNLNQLTGITNNAATYVHGTASHQPAQVTVADVNATVNPADKSFSTYLYLPPGANIIPVRAIDLAGNVKISNFSMLAGQTLTYDANGNLTNDGNFHYDWDAADRLIQISTQNPSPSNPPISTKFTYDGMWRRVGIKEKQGVITVADRKFIWDGANIVEERDASNTTVKRFYEQGVQVGSTNYYYLRDHLGSVRDVLDATGAVIATYDYDLWGNRTQTAGTFVADFGYAGYLEHQPSGLALTQYRAYSPLTGRWLSRDPIGERGGMNLYGYVGNHPLLGSDPLGLIFADYFRWVDPIADFAAGFDKTFTFGIGGIIRDEYNIGGVDKCSQAYDAGKFAGVVAQIGFAVAGAYDAVGEIAAFGPRGSLLGRGVGILNDNDLISPFVRVGWNWAGSTTEGSEVIRLAIGESGDLINFHINLDSVITPFL